MFVEKLLAPKFHCSNVGSKVPVPKFAPKFHCSKVTGLKVWLQCLLQGVLPCWITVHIQRFDEGLMFAFWYNTFYQLSQTDLDLEFCYAPRFLGCNILVKLPNLWQGSTKILKFFFLIFEFWVFCWRIWGENTRLSSQKPTVGHTIFCFLAGFHLLPETNGMGEINAKPTVGHTIFCFLAGFAFKSPMPSASTPPPKPARK